MNNYKNTTSNSDLLLSDVVYHQFILSVWAEYVKFVEIPNTPFPSNIEIIFCDNTNNDSQTRELAKLVLDDENNDNFNFYIERQLATSTLLLYHEFTHIVDKVILKQPIGSKILTGISSSILEIRAEYIMCLYDAGLKSISDDTLLTKENTLSSDGTSLRDEIYSKQKEILGYISSIEPDNITNKDDIVSKIAFVYNQLQYYLGFCLFIEDKTDMTVVNDNIISRALPLLGNNIYDIFNLAYEIPTTMEIIDEDFIVQYGKLFFDCVLYYKRKFN